MNRKTKFMRTEFSGGDQTKDRFIHQLNQAPGSMGMEADDITNTDLEMDQGRESVLSEADTLVNVNETVILAEWTHFADPTLENTQFLM